MPDVSPQDAAIEQRARKIRRSGYIFFGSITLWLVVSLIISAVSALNDGNREIRDPFNGELVNDEQPRCEEWGQQTLSRGQKMGDDPPTEQVARWRIVADAWLWRCGHYAPEVSTDIEALRGPITAPL